VAVLSDQPIDPLSRRWREERATALGLEHHILAVRGPDDFEAAFKEARRWGAGAVSIRPSALTYIYRSPIASAAMAFGLPTVGWFRAFAEAGGLMTYAADERELLRRTAHYIDRILKGAKPADLPVERLLEQHPDARELEKREADVSVLFLDVEGYTRLSEQVPPQRLNRMIQDYFSAFLEIIRANHGDVNETAGDGLMVIFQSEGGPARHALNAAGAAFQQWRRHYNEVRPHSSLGYLTPIEFKASGGARLTEGRAPAAAARADEGEHADRPNDQHTLTERPTSAVLQ
jgi:class 3 adenylate cyclase